MLQYEPCHIHEILMVFVEFTDTTFGSLLDF